jgi:hypothetical protein
LLPLTVFSFFTRASITNDSSPPNIVYLLLA